MKSSQEVNHDLFTHKAIREGFFQWLRHAWKLLASSLIRDQKKYFADYNDVKMGAMASEISSLTIVYSTVV